MAIHREVAVPGDSDLDLDVHDLYVDHIVQLGNDFIITLLEGRGAFFDAIVTLLFGEVEQVTMEICVTFITADQVLIDRVRTMLDRWQRTKQLLRMVAAPTRLGCLFSQYPLVDDEWLPIPRHWLSSDSSERSS